MIQQQHVINVAIKFNKTLPIQALEKQISCTILLQQVRPASYRGSHSVVYIFIVIVIEQFREYHTNGGKVYQPP